MIRKIIKINQDICNGCGLCAKACHEHAIGMIDGKATLLRDDYCDGLGDCLPACPTNAITFENREAADYDKAAVDANNEQINKSVLSTPILPPCTIQSQLCQWPVQIQLASVHAPYFKNAKLLIAADCTAYAYGNFHQDFMKACVTLIGCPKLDTVVYTEKLTEIIKHNDIKSLHIVRMEVPCCAGIEHAAKTALQNSGKFIPWQVTTISTDGTILD